MDIFALIFLIVSGLALGSFATALSYRLPRGISIVKKVRSSCPSCGHTLGVPDLVPVFSWLFLKGKCRHCRKPIGRRYLAIECTTLFLCLISFLLCGMSFETACLFALAPVLVSIVAIDIEHQIIPDSLNLCVAVIGAIFHALSFDGADTVAQAAGGALLYGGISFGLRALCARFLGREPMGLGDVKFFAAAGVWLGYDLEIFARFLLLGGVFGVALAFLWKKTRKAREFPFGPALVCAFFILLLSYRV